MRILTGLCFVFGMFTFVMSFILLIARQQTPQPPYIAFASARDRNFELYKIQPDGGHLTRLTHDPNQDFSPAWSPDGKWIAFTSRRDEGKSSALYVMNANGKGVKRLTYLEGDELTPAFSPDSKWIAFALLSPDTLGLFIIRVSGGEPIQIIDQSTPVYHPSWSPDGQWIVYYGLVRNQFDLFRARADGSEITNLTNSPENEFEPNYSPDGTWLSFASNDAFGDAELFLMRPDGSEAHPITASSTDEVEAEWSPDGEWLVYTEIQDVFGRLMRINPSSGEQVLLLDSDYYDSEPAWSPIIDLPLNFAYLLAAAVGISIGGRYAFRKSPHSKDR